MSVAKRFPDALVLAADTLVHLETTLFGKPATLEEAYQMLERLQGRTHQVVTGICLLHLRKHRQAVFVESTAVTFHPLDAVKIRRYLDRVNPLDKAGAYAIQEEGDLIVEKIAGSYTNVVGLPMERLTRGAGSLGAEAEGVTRSCAWAQFLPQMRAHQLALGKAIEVELLVGRVRVVVGQRQSQQERVGAENFLEIIDNGNRAAFSHEHRLATESQLQRAQGGLRLRAGGRDQIGLRPMAGT